MLPRLAVEEEPAWAGVASCLGAVVPGTLLAVEAAERVAAGEAVRAAEAG